MQLLIIYSTSPHIYWWNLPTHLLVEPLHTFIGGTSPHTYWWNLPTHILVEPTHALIDGTYLHIFGSTYPCIYWRYLCKPTHLLVEPFHTLISGTYPHTSFRCPVCIRGYTCHICRLHLCYYVPQDCYLSKQRGTHRGRHGNHLCPLNNFHLE